MTSIDGPLTEAQISFFHEQGYLAVEALADPDELTWLREAYDRIFAERAGRETGNQFDLAGPDEEGSEPSLPQILNPAKYAPQINESKLLENAQAAGRQLLGPSAKVGFAHAIYKPPRAGAETPWHQDASYWPPQFIHKTISLWVPLQEATLENGCMQFVPGSHKLDVVRHQSIGNDPRVHGLEVHPDELHQTENYVSCPLPAGGATVHGGYMFHHTPPNRSDIPRRALILAGGIENETRREPRRFPWQEEKRTARAERAAASASS